MGRNRLLEQGQCRGVGNHPKGHSPSQGCGSHPSDRRQTGHCLKQGGDGKGMVSTGVNFNPKYFLHFFAICMSFLLTSPN
jgi:hypothetical protein